MTPKVSVILPARNAERTLRLAVESVLKQDYNNIEVIISVNGSHDGTLEVANSIKDDRVIVIETQPGIVPALNSALKISKGKYIARQDADDIWLENKLKQQIKILEDGYIDVLGTQMIVNSTDEQMKLTNYPIEHEDCVDWLINGKNPIGHPTVVFRQSLLEKVGGYWEAFPLAEDLDLWMRMLIHAKFSNTNFPGIIYNHVPNENYNPQVVIAIMNHYRNLFGIKRF